MNKELKEKARINAITKSWHKSELLQECIDFTGAKCFDYYESNKISNEFEEKIPINQYGRMDFAKFKLTNTIVHVNELYQFVDKSKEFYIIWSNVELPCLKVDIDTIIKFIDDVTAVSFDTWLVSLDYKIIIEFYHEGEITLGIFALE